MARLNLLTYLVDAPRASMVEGTRSSDGPGTDLAILMAGFVRLPVVTARR